MKNQHDQRALPVMVLDLGTSVFKCGIISQSLEIITKQEYFVHYEGSPLRYEIDFDVSYSKVLELMKSVLDAAKNKRYMPAALIITSQAQTFVPVDFEFKPLMPGISWLDSRASAEGVFLSQKLKDFPSKSGFYKASPMLYISKLLWLKNKRPAIFQRAHYFPLLPEYLVYRLTTDFYSDVTNFGMTGLFDMQQRVINPQILSLLNLRAAQFPKLAKALGLAQKIQENVRNELNVITPFRVFSGGNDQAASAYGAGVKQYGDININFGTAMVFYTIIKMKIKNQQPDQIIGIDPMTNDYFYISYEKDFGTILKKLKQTFFSGTSYDDLFATYYLIKKSDNFIPLTEIKIDWLDGSIKNYKQFAGSIIDFYLKRFRHHLQKIERITRPRNIFISGGFAQSKIWLNLLQEHCPYTLVSSRQQEAGLIGAAYMYFKNLPAGSEYGKIHL